MDKFKAGVYKIQHAINGNMYVGSSTNIEKRWSQHRRALKAGKHDIPAMQQDWNEYGATIFTFSVLEYVDSPDSLIHREQHWLDEFDAAKKGYNRSPTAGNNTGLKMSDETRKKMSDSATGHVKSEQHRKSLSAANTGKKMSDEARQKMRDAKLGKKRPPHSEETKAKMSAVKMGKRPSPETLIKMSLVRMGKPLSPETKLKMSMSQRARHVVKLE